MENVYEGMFILDSNRYGRDPSGVSSQISDLVTKLGGTMLVSRLWEERRLAYAINGQRKGTYWLTYFRLEGTKLATLNRECQINDNMVRSLVLKVDPRIVEALVEHAKAGPGEAARRRDQAAAAARPTPVAVAIDEVAIDAVAIDAIGDIPAEE
ncbi:MAG TPA: 30S ribosomal protein S6 [Pirellulales bacterium]